MLLNCRQFNVKISADLRLESPEIQEAMQRFFQYWAGYWLVTQTPARISVHGQRNRTNNDVESWNRWFNARCHGHRQNFWDFVCKYSYYYNQLCFFFNLYSLYCEFLVHLQECEESARLDFIALSQGQDIRREAVSVQAAERERLIIRREQDLEDGLISLYEFLHQSMSCFEPAEVNIT